MAGIHGSITRSAIASGTAAKTIGQLIAAANHRVMLKGWGVSLAGIVATEAPVLVELVRQTTAGTTTALTPVKIDETDDETLQTTARHTATAEPTTGDIIESHEVHPQGGSFDVIYSHPGKTIMGGGRLGIRVTAGVTVNCTFWMDFEE